MKETLLVPGEPPCPRPRKWRVWWWFDNDEASAQGNTLVYRYLRNPAQNLRWYVLGVVDRDHTVSGTPVDHDSDGKPVFVNLLSDMVPPRTGWTLSWVNNWLPYVSYSGKKPASGSDGIAFYLGWQPRGCLGGRLTPLWAFAAFVLIPLVGVVGWLSFRFHLVPGL